jgi:predicted CoA-substrate-specific enzyme activase
MYILGLDAGSVFTKSALIEDGNMVLNDAVYSGGDFQRAASAVIEAALGKGRISRREDLQIVSTGCGSELVPGAKTLLSDISCQARGVNYFFPSVRTIIEIGSRSSKVIKVDGHGRMVNFAVSERCAAGSGKFLQLISRITGIDIEKMGEISLRSKGGAKFTTGCAVFAETEVISRIAEGIPVEDILAGIHDVMAGKILNLVQGIKIEGDLAVTGGGAKDTGLLKALEDKLGMRVCVPGEPLVTAALGAALIGREGLPGKNHAGV